MGKLGSQFSLDAWFSDRPGFSCALVGFLAIVIVLKIGLQMEPSVRPLF